MYVLNSSFIYTSYMILEYTSVYIIRFKERTIRTEERKFYFSLSNTQKSDNSNNTNDDYSISLVH